MNNVYLGREDNQRSIRLCIFLCLSLVFCCRCQRKDVTKRYYVRSDDVLQYNCLLEGVKSFLMPDVSLLSSFDRKQT